MSIDLGKMALDWWRSTGNPDADWEDCDETLLPVEEDLKAVLEQVEAKTDEAWRSFIRDLANGEPVRAIVNEEEGTVRAFTPEGMMDVLRSVISRPAGGGV